MPVKWTPDNDQLLLLKILETHDISVDAKKISAAWPEKGEIPTARAITERLVKIRQVARVNGAGHFGISSSQAKSSTGKTGTPRKPRPIATSSAFANGIRASTFGSAEDDDENMEMSSPPKRKLEAITNIKVESIETDGFEVVEDGTAFNSAIRTPSRVMSRFPGRVDDMTSGFVNSRALSTLHVNDESPTKKARQEHDVCGGSPNRNNGSLSKDLHGGHSVLLGRYSSGDDGDDDVV